MSGSPTAVPRTGHDPARPTQFALIETASSARLQFGMNLADEPATDRLLLAGGMRTHTVSVTSAEEIDAELLGWLRQAHDDG